MIDVVWTGNRVVAIGSACEPAGGGCRGIAWTSDDGRSWNREADELEGTPYSMAMRGGRLVAVGDDGAGHPRSWISDDDGSTWRSGRPLAAILGNFDAVIDTPGGLVGSIATPDLTTAHRGLHRRTLVAGRRRPGIAGCRRDQRPWLGPCPRSGRRSRLGRPDARGRRLDRAMNPRRAAQP